MTVSFAVTAPDGVRIQRLRWWHIEQLLPIEADLFGAEQWSAAMFWSELACGHYYLVALDPDDSVVGYAGLSVSPPDEAWVQNVAVRRDRQRRGVARALLEQLLAQADRQGIGSVLLEVAADNTAAQALYDRYGFIKVGVRRGYYQLTNTDAWVLRRDV
jgi:[ribosomal protein S18]-alanine N-acetyltransferase